VGEQPAFASVWQDYAWAQALKVALACLIIIALSNLLQLEGGFMALLPITIIAVMFPHQVLTMALQRLLGAALGFVAGSMLLSIDLGLGLGLALLLGLIVISRLVAQRDLMPYAATLFGLTVAAMFILGADDANAGATFGWLWTRNIALGVLVLFLVEHLVAPNQVPKTYQRLMRALARASQPVDAADRGRGWTQANLQRARQLVLASRSHRPEAWIARELGRIAILARVDRYASAAAQAYRRAAASPALVAPFAPRLQALGAAAARARGTADGSNPAALNAALRALEHEIASIDNALATARAAGQTRRFHWRKLYALLAGIGFEQRQARALRQLTAAEDAAASGAATLGEPPAPDSAQRQFGRALRISLPVVIASALALLLALPGGLQIVIASLLASIQPNIGRLTRHMIERLTGLWIGALFSLAAAMIVAHLQALWLFMALFGGGILAATYLALAYPRHGYVALQAGLALTLVLGVDMNSPQADLAVLGERIFGLFFGYGVAFLVAALLFPDRPSLLLPRRIGTYLERLGSGLGCVAERDTGPCALRPAGIAAAIAELAEHGESEPGLSTTRRRSLQRAARGVERLDLEVTLLDGLLRRRPTSTAHIVIMLGPQLRQLSALCLAIGQELREHGEVDASRRRQLQPLLNELRQAVARYRSEGSSRALPTPMLLDLATAAMSMHNLARLLGAILRSGMAARTRQGQRDRRLTRGKIPASDTAKALV
jgi:uncharacterized membrane protein YccC